MGNTLFCANVGDSRYSRVAVPSPRLFQDISFHFGFRESRLRPASLVYLDRALVTTRSGSVVPLSSDHKPERVDEKERIEKAGGEVCLLSITCCFDL